MSNRFTYGIFLNNLLIGFINDVEINITEIELGFVISPLYKNNGYATEVLLNAINVLVEMWYNLIKTGVFENNIANIKVMEKCKMIRLNYITTIEYKDEIHRCVWFKKNILNNLDIKNIRIIFTFIYKIIMENCWNMLYTTIYK